MAPQVTRNKLLTAPAAANSIVLTPNASAWANSAWVTLIASAAADLIITAVIVTPGDQNVAKDFEIDIGTGAAASEVVIGTCRGAYGSAHYSNPGFIPLPIALDNVAAGVRVAARMRKSTTSASPTWAVAISYYQKPILGGGIFSSAKPQKSTPSAANPIIMSTGGSAWSNSTWTTVVASTSTAIVLTGIVTELISLDMSWEIDVGIGAAASETVLTTIRFHHVGIQLVDGPGYFPLFHPLDAIPIASRLSARTRSQLTSGTRTPSIALTYIEKPL